MSSLFKVHFTSNIDFYSHKPFPSFLLFRPQVGDRVPFKSQEKYHPQYPVLAVSSVEYMLDEQGDVVGFNCYLHFDKNTHESICKKILNHERL